MPIWTYRCKKEECQKEVEVLVITSEDRKRYTIDLIEQCHPDPCPNCGEKMVRIMSLTARGRVK